MVLDKAKEIEVIISRDEQKHCSLIIPDLENVTINLSNSETVDIEVFFNKIFKWVIENKRLISFFTNDGENDLYNEMTKELISQLNNEIKQSETDFYAIIEVLGSSQEEHD